MAIVLSDICKSYGANTVLHNFNCCIDEGSVTCIMGSSGIGKTVLLRIMLDLEHLDSGEVTGLYNLRKSVVFQEDRLCENLTVPSNIRLVCRKTLNDISKAMHAVGLAEDFALQVRDMSGGQRRRVAILRALMAEYDILFMDEPFKGLDAQTKQMVMLYTKERTLNKTVVFTTHDEGECAFMGGKTVFIERCN